MKTFNTGSVFKLLAGLVLLGLMLNSQTFAAGTTQGTNVSNQATISYSVGGTPQADIDSDDPFLPGAADSTDFLVDELIDATITADTIAQEVIGTIVEAAVITVRNTGNGTQDFVPGFEDHNPGPGNDLFDLATVVFHADTNGDGDYDAGTDLPIAGGFISLPVDTDTIIFAVATVPGGLSNGDFSNVHWTLQASNGATVILNDDAGAFDQDTVQIVFGDGANTDLLTNTGTADIAEDGLVSSATVTYTVEGLTVTKAVSVVSNPAGVTGDLRAVPGSTIRYTITIANSGTAGSGDATGIAIDDTIDTASLDTAGSFPATLTAGCTQEAGFADNSAGATLDISGITVAGGATCVVTFDALIQ